jgi:uncharacterized protein YgiM (DUF1202 family)
MPPHPRRARHWLVLVLVAMLAIVPAIGQVDTASAATRLLVGGAAVVDDDQGGTVRLRDQPSLDGAVLANVPDGSLLEVLGGPVQGDGYSWYPVAYDGETGYMASTYLAPYDGSGGGAGDTAVVTDRVNLRSGPGTGYDVVAPLAVGDEVTLTGGAEGGFYPVDWYGTEGWVYGAFLAIGAASNDYSLSEVATAADAWTTDNLRLRTAPSEDADIIDVIPAGSAVTVWGDAGNGFSEVDWDGQFGYAATAYLSDTRPTITTTMWTTDNVNFRTEAGLTSRVIRVVPFGTAVAATGDSANGFLAVTIDGEAGWISADYLADSEPAAPPAAASGAIIWPMSGGEWKVTQGYNGPWTHYNAGSLWQYYYSFDLKRSDGDTAGQNVYAPASGSVRWTEPETGGIVIDMGNGYAVALFHVIVDPSIGDGDTITQGQYLGYVAYAGYGGNGGSPHIHFNLWASDDGGNWSRDAIPFTGVFAISGEEFPDVGGGNQWSGYLIYP